MPAVDDALDGHRPRPTPSYRIAPPVTDAYAPWVSVLDDELAPGHFAWALVDGALVPVPVSADEPQILPKRRRWSRRTQ